MRNGAVATKPGGLRVTSFHFSRSGEHGSLRQNPDAHMKRIPALILVLLVAQCLTGCLSTTYRMNSGMSAGSSSGTVAGVVAAGALDVVTLPIQAPFLVGIAASNPSLMSGNAKGKSTAIPTRTETTPTQPVEAPVDRMNIQAHILKDPEYLFSHRHLLTREKVCLLIADRKIPFTADQLRRLGGTNEWTRTYVAGNWRCPPDLLEDIWQGLPAMPDAERPIAAANLVSNPNVPIAWLVEIMKRRDLYGDAASKAAGVYYLGGRGPPFRPGTLPAAVPQPPGK